jgi:hypothetical protein
VSQLRKPHLGVRYDRFEITKGLACWKKAQRKEEIIPLELEAVQAKDAQT